MNFSRNAPLVVSIERIVVKNGLYHIPHLLGTFKTFYRLYPWHGPLKLCLNLKKIKMGGDGFGRGCTDLKKLEIVNFNIEQIWRKKEKIECWHSSGFIHGILSFTDSIQFRNTSNLWHVCLQILKIFSLFMLAFSRRIPCLLKIPCSC